MTDSTPQFIMFFDFSSAFSVIQSRVLKVKLEDMQADAPMVKWTDDNLMGRLQFESFRAVCLNV